MENRPLYIMHVDDDNFFLEILGFWLKSKGHKVISIESGTEALDVLKKETPDIILLDIDMPDMNGIETLQHIRDRKINIPVIMVTAHATQERKDEAIKIGVSGFYNKSDDFSEAALLIQSALGAWK